MAISTKELEALASVLKSELIKELESQGHNDTRTLINSIDVEVLASEIFDKINIIGSSVRYGEAVDTGRTKGKKPPPVSVLLEWVKRKNFILKKGQTEKGIAFAIKKTMKKYGSPSKNGRFLAEKTKFVEKTLTKNEKQIESTIEDFVISIYTKFLGDFIAIKNQEFN